MLNYQRSDKEIKKKQSKTYTKTQAKLKYLSGRGTSDKRRNQTKSSQKGTFSISVIHCAIKDMMEIKNN